MAWLGFVTWITIYVCLFLAVVTGRLGWALRYIISIQPVAQVVANYAGQ